MDDLFEELDCFLCSSRNKQLVFDPLGELVNRDVHVLKTTWHRLERQIMSSPQHAKDQEAGMVYNSCAGT